jgi:hypothetical protein
MAVAPLSRRDVYADLLRDTRGMRREHASARDAWYAGLALERKEEVLFELEMLLKGFACFGNPRNQPGPAQRPPAVARDFREELRIVRDALSQSVAQIRLLLGPKDRAYVFSRYLESVLPEDAERTRLVREQLNQDTPEEALFVMRNAFGSFLEMADGMLRLARVPHRLYFALLGTITREIGRNAYFNPLTTLEFRSEFDRIRNAQVLEALHSVEHEAPHRVAALAFLTLFRALKYLDLVDGYAKDPATTRRAYVVLAVLRSDLRAIVRFLTRRSGDVLAAGLERAILAVPASELSSRHEALAGEAKALVALRGALEGIAHGLNVDLRKVFERELPEADAPIVDDELGLRLREAAQDLRASVHHAIRALSAELTPDVEPPSLDDLDEARRRSAERLRRDVWIFSQILRAFLAKGYAAKGDENLWATYASFRFVHEFLAHFRAIGYQLVRHSDYARLDAFLAALDSLRTADLLAPDRLRLAIDECTGFYEYLEDLFERISRRAELEGRAFDKREAAETLRVYLGAA